MGIFIFENQTSNGNTDPVTLDFHGGEGQLEVSGNFDGATVTFSSANQDGSEYIGVYDLGGVSVSVTAARKIPIKFHYGESIRATIASAGGSTNLDCYFYPSR